MSTPKTYEDWLALSADEKEALSSGWDAYRRQAIGFPYTAAGRLAIASTTPILDVRVGTYHGGEYVLHAYVDDDAIDMLPKMLEQTFEGFRVIWLPVSKL